MNEAIRKICSRLIVFASAVLLMSCTHESTEIFDQKSNSIRLSYSFNHITSTKALATGSENPISEIGLMFYDTTTDLYVANVVVEVTSTGEPTGDADFVTPKPLLENTTYKVLALAKGSAQFSGDQTMEDYLTSCASKDYEKMKLDASTSNAQRISTPLSFCGETTFINRGENISPISVVLTRSVAKVTLRNSAGNLHVKWAKTAMYRSDGYLYHQQLYPGKIIKGSDGVAGISPIDQYIGEKLYAYPNMVGVTKQNDKLTTCLLVAAYYQKDAWTGTPAEGSKLTYYRINIARGSGSSQLLKRNNVYNVTINSAAGEGSDNEDDALGAPDNKLNTSINDWEEDNDGSVITDPNGNYIRISNSNLVMQPAANETKTVTIQVKHDTYWVARLKSGSEFFSIEQDPNNVEKLNVKTLVDGHATDTRRGEVEIIVFNSINGQQISNLVASINLMQFPKSMEVSMLSVDGKIAPFKIEASKMGEVYYYEVITGSQNNRWVALGEGAIASWVDFSKNGVNGSLLRLLVSRNVDTGRAGRITVHFDGDRDGKPDVGADVPPAIDITIEQKVVDQLISVYPSYSNEKTLELNVLGESPKEAIRITTPDQSVYPKFRVTLNVPRKYAYLMGSSGQVADLSSSLLLPIGSTFTILTVARYPNPNEIGSVDVWLVEPTGGDAAGIFYNFPVVLNSEASFATPQTNTGVEGHAYRTMPDGRKLYIYDRNAGAIAVELAPDALYYDPNFPDINKEFLGKRYLANSTSCPEGWIRPTKIEGAVIVEHMRGGEGRSFFISEKKDGKGLPIVTYFTDGLNWLENPDPLPVWISGYMSIAGSLSSVGTLNVASLSSQGVQRCIKYGN